MTPLEQHVETWKGCMCCPLAFQRGRIVLGRGDVPCDVLFIGEAPGSSEDSLGVPFVGPAGHLLDQIVERSVPGGLRVAYTNLVACYPAEAKAAGANEPAPAEVEACRPRLEQFIAIAKPRLIVRVGKLAVAHADAGNLAEYVDIVHPAAVLRMPAAQQDMAVRRVIAAISAAASELTQ